MIAEPPALEELVLLSTVLGTLRDLARAPRLQYLRLGDCSVVRPHELAPLAFCRQLRQITLDLGDLSKTDHRAIERVRAFATSCSAATVTLMTRTHVAKETACELEKLKNLKILRGNEPFCKSRDLDRLRSRGVHISAISGQVRARLFQD